MNRTDYMKAVYETELDPESKSILVFFGFCKNWKEGTMAFPSYARIAKSTGLSETTVKRRVPVLREKGYLSDTGERKGRGVVVYDLADPTGICETPCGISETPQKYLTDTAEVSVRHTEQVHELERELEMEQVHEPPVSDEPVDTDSLNNEVKKGFQYLELLLDRNSANSSASKKARDLYEDETWEPSIQGVYRAAYVVRHLTTNSKEVAA